VAALDGFGLPGSRSQSRQVRIQPDATPPFLRIDRPADDEILREASLELKGRAEPGARLLLDGEPVEIGADGSFALTYQAAIGPNLIELDAIDAAGNVTRRERRFAMMPDVEESIAFALSIPRRGVLHFLTGGDELTLSGTTRPKARLRVGGEGRAPVTTVADEAGAFRLNLPVEGKDQAFVVSVTAPSGFRTDDDIVVSVDREPPTITLDTPPPPVTAATSITLSGEVDEEATVTRNGLPLARTDGRFAAVLPLADERTGIELAATDLVGNLQLLSFDVRLDRTPPALLAHDVDPDPAALGQAYLLEVEASDSSGMQRAAAFTLEVGGQTETGFMNLDPASGRYLAKVVLAEPARAPVRLRDVVLEDYAGNRRRYMIE
jgi:hypothetical protein